MRLAGGIALGLGAPWAQAELHWGPAWDDYRLTLRPGEATEAFGPLWGSERSDGSWLWRLSPFVSHIEDPAIQRSEYEVLYPIFSYGRFGGEYAARFLQFFEFTGSTTPDDEAKDRKTLFPFFYYQKSTNPTNGYCAVLPLYGHLRNRLFRDEVSFVLAPLWVSSKKRGVQTDNVLFPFFHSRHGAGVQGWQMWPLVGSESKEITYRLNNLEEREVVPGHERQFFLLPFFIHERTGIGTENAATSWYFFPAYLQTRSPEMDYTSVFFFAHRTNRVEKFSEWSAPWPFIGWANGPGKTARRIWPLWGRASSPSLESDFLFWPLYTHRGLTGPTLRRDRTRMLYFAYSDQHLVNTANGDDYRRRDLWPLFTWRKELNGQSRLQVFAPVEPLLPTNQSIERLYAPIWSVYRAEADPKTGQASQSLLWNFWRRDVTPIRTRTSFLFGAVQTQKTASGRQWRFLWRSFNARSRSRIEPP